MYKQKIKTSLFFITILVVVFDAFPLTTFSITKTGRRVQLDGFLLEWIKDSAKAMGVDSRWTWDALNTKEGLTGYFKAPAATGADWTFTFLPERLSSYSKMQMFFSPDSSRPFYRVSQPGNSLDSSITAEWVIPWKNISLDSSGDYKVGIVAFNSRGDTLPAMVLCGRAFHEKTAGPWGKVHVKTILLVALLIALFYAQKKVKKKTMLKKKRSGP
jgi:hypothetical protein